MSSKHTHTTQQYRAQRSTSFTKTFLRLEAAYVISGNELARGMLLSFALGFGIALFCFLVFH